MTNTIMPPDPARPDTANLELTIEQRETEGLSQGQIVRRRFFRHKGAMSASAMLLFTIIFVYSSIGVEIYNFRIPGWWMWNYTETSDIVNAGNPTWNTLFAPGDHPFGQDQIGRDIFARVMRGTQQSIVVMVLYGLIASFLGVVIGAVAGYYRGWLDNLLMRLTDLVIVIPIIVIAAVIGRGAGASGAVVLGLLLGLVGWTGLARLVRGEFLGLREREFVDAARVAGASGARIVFKHILPNAVGVVIVSMTLLMSAAILLEAAISFLGFGIRQPDVSLGQIINEYQGAFATRPWLFWWPGLMIIILVLTINFIGDGLRDAFDPRQKRAPGTVGPYRRMWAMMIGRDGRGTPRVRGLGEQTPTGSSAAPPGDPKSPKGPRR